MLQLLRLFVVIGSSLTLASCVWQGGLQAPKSDAFALSYASSIADAESCATAINDNNHRNTDAVTLPNDEIRLFNWNVQKNTGANMQQDMSELATQADLILLQEATLGSSRLSSADGGFHWAFAPGYETTRELTGVMTASKVAPITHCSFRNIEPWLGSPKATNVTQYALADRDDTLLVINLHLINFTLGIENMQEQLDEALAMVEKHWGPVIISGDFNTWSEARDQSVSTSLLNAGLHPVSYETDVRRRFFGHAVDHIYIKGMRAEPATSYEVSSSDHNPLSVVLKLNETAIASAYNSDDNG